MASVALVQTTSPAGFSLISLDFNKIVLIYCSCCSLIFNKTIGKQIEQAIILLKAPETAEFQKSFLSFKFSLKVSYKYIVKVPSKANKTPIEYPLQYPWIPSTFQVFIKDSIVSLNQVSLFCIKIALVLITNKGFDKKLPKTAACAATKNL